MLRTDEYPARSLTLVCFITFITRDEIFSIYCEVRNEFLDITYSTKNLI
jgi:hypothetical protein